MMLQVLKNEKFLKYGRILFEVVRALYFIGATIVGLFYTVVLADPNGRQTILQAALSGLKDLLTFPPAIAFVAYIFAVFSYNKRQFIKRVTWISVFSILIVFLSQYIPYNFPRIDNDIFALTSLYIFYASTFWGMVGLCLPKDCFLNHQPTRTTQMLRIIFYFIVSISFLSFPVYRIIRLLAVP